MVTTRGCYIPYSTRNSLISVTVKNKPTIRQTLKKEITAWNTKTVMENIMCYSIHNLMMSTICSKKSFTHFQQTTSVLFENQIQRSTWDTLYKLDGLASFVAPAKALWTFWSYIFYSNSYKRITNMQFNDKNNLIFFLENYYNKMKNAKEITKGKLST